MHFVNNQRPKIRSVYYQSHETTEKEASMGMRIAQLFFTSKRSVPKIHFSKPIGEWSRNDFRLRINPRMLYLFIYISGYHANQTEKDPISARIQIQTQNFWYNL